MQGALFIDGERQDSVELYEEDGYRIQYEQETDAEYRCAKCGDTLADYGDHYESDTATCRENTIDEPGTDETIEGPHVPEAIPLTFFNSAAIDMDAEEDSVTVSISVGDPRGAFAFTIRRLPAHAFEAYKDDASKCAVCYEDLSDKRHRGTGRLIMHVPYEGMGWAHRPLKRVSDGTYEID